MIQALYYGQSFREAVDILHSSGYAPTDGLMVNFQRNRSNIREHTAQLVY